jgi:hypothetical protein
VYRFEGELFHGEAVEVYLVELPDRVVLIDIPAFRTESAATTRGDIRAISRSSTHDSDSQLIR